MDSQAIYRSKGKNVTDYAIQTRELTKIFKGDLGKRPVTALDALNLQITRGEVFAFLGPNGAGKTTTIKLLTRLLFPTRGHISVLGYERLSARAMKTIGYLPEQPRFYDYLSGTEMLDLIGRLFGMTPAARKQRIAELVDLVGLAGRSRQAIRHYSRGMVQRLGLAQAVMNDPELLILDEPMASLDPLGRKDFRDLILQFKARGTTIFFSSHILSDAEMLADRVGILNQGSLVRIGTLADLNHQILETEIMCVLDTKSRKKLNITGEIVSQDQVLIACPEEQSQEWIRKIMSAGGQIVSVTPRRKSLESMFIDEMER